LQDSTPAEPPFAATADFQAPAQFDVDFSATERAIAPSKWLTVGTAGSHRYNGGQGIPEISGVNKTTWFK
jgi:hypothetical protein